MKMIKNTLQIFFCFFYLAGYSQLADVTYSVQTVNVTSYEDFAGGAACWENGNEEYTAYVGAWDNVNGTLVGTGCQTCDNNGNCSYAANINLQARTNNAYSIFSSIDAWEDDRGGRCSFDGPCFLCNADDCRRQETTFYNFREQAYPSNGTYTNGPTWGSTANHQWTLRAAWRYSGTANLITPTCTVQNTGYSAGQIRSWSVNLTAGVTYNFNNCSSAANDTYLRIYGPDGYSIVALGDDNCGALSSVNYTAGTTGTYYIELSQFSRGALANAGTLSYSIVTPTLGTLSNPGPINFCDASGNFGTALNVTGQTGNVIWDWGSNNGVWNNNWIAGNNSGVCCFPKKVSNNDGNADRIRYRVTNGPCSVTSGTILIQNRYNESPTSLIISPSSYCSDAVPASVTLTANFPSNINMNGTVSFYSGSCGGTLIGSVVANANSPVASLTFTAPSGTTTYFVRYEPGVGAGCSNSTCISTTLTVNTLSTSPTITPISGTICPNTNTTLSAVGGVAGTGSFIYWYSGPNGTGSLLGTGSSIVVAPSVSTTYYARREGTCNVSADASVTVNVKTFIYASNGTSTNTYCTDNSGWKHFYVGDQIIFSAQGDFSSAPIGYPVVTIYDNGVYYQQTEGPGTAPGCTSNQNPNEERFEMKRSWNLDMGGGAPIGSYNIRFYYQPSEKAAIETAASNWIATYPDCGYGYKYPNPLGFYWFKNSGSNYSAPDFDGTQFSASVSSIAGVNYSEWNGISGFSGGSGAIILEPISALPITLSSFTAVCDVSSNEVNVQWRTASEDKTSHYSVDRSVDGITWETIGIVAAAGYSTSTLHYELLDKDTRGNSTFYYRLNQYDIDGQHETFGPISAECLNLQNTFEIFPNPAGTDVTVLLNGVQLNEETILIFSDINGKEVKRIVCDEQKGKLMTIDLRNLESGIYFVRLLNNDLNGQIVRLIKE